MNALLLLVATAAVGVEVGWTPLPDGGVEYIIQIEPDLLDTLAKDHDLSSVLPTGLDVRSFRITVGTGPVQRVMPTAPAPPARTSDGRRYPPSTAPPGGGGYNPAGSAAMGSPQPIAQPPIQPTMPPPNTAPPLNPMPPIAAMPPASSPTAANPTSPPQNVPTLATPPITDPAAAGPSAPPTAAYVPPPPTGPANVPSGPALGPAMAAPTTGPSLDTPEAIAARTRTAVSNAVDDPNAPGRNPLSETGQPHLPGAGRRTNPPATLDPDPDSGQLAEYKAMQHEAQRQNERNGTDNYVLPQPVGDRPAGEHPVGQRAPMQYASANGPAHTMHEASRGTAGSEKPAETQWPPLMAAVTMLLVSISANVYLAWVAWESRMRYRELLAEHGSSSPLAA